VGKWQQTKTCGKTPFSVFCFFFFFFLFKKMPGRRTEVAATTKQLMSSDLSLLLEFLGALQL
jgi:hypothetical protein